MQARRLIRVISHELTESIPCEVLQRAVPVARKRAHNIIGRGSMLDWELDSMLVLMYLQAGIDYTDAAMRAGWLENIDERQS